MSVPISMKLLREPICLLDRINAIGFEYRNAGTLTVNLIKFSSTVDIRPFSFHPDSSSIPSFIDGKRAAREK